MAAALDKGGDTGYRIPGSRVFEIGAFYLQLEPGLGSAKYDRLLAALIERVWPVAPS
jgi:hypothetical protein